jgi:hypothetical protein
LTKATVTPLTVVIQTVEPGVPPNAGLFIGIQDKENRMARVASRVAAKRKGQTAALPFTKRNYQILGIGLLLIVLGYIALSQEPWDGMMPLVVAPILLVLGYCVVIPLGILYRGKPPKQPTETSTTAEPQA